MKHTSSVIFIDASVWIALYHKKDKYHKSAWKLYEQLLEEGKRFITSNWVSYEAISILKSRASYETAKNLWEILSNNEFFQVLRIDKNIEDQAISIFWRYQDKTWGVVDCSSMLLMKKENCFLAFGYDYHFVEASKQYGFTLLK
ncbi:MAG: PIN domain-containing protein [bacterium]